MGKIELKIMSEHNFYSLEFCSLNLIITIYKYIKNNKIHNDLFVFLHLSKSKKEVKHFSISSNLRIPSPSLSPGFLYFIGMSSHYSLFFTYYPHI